ncbi:MAG TPA: OprD family porin [Pseudomonas sp.]|uniref:OprD family porin n=1 Tax=Pseudomonas sp. TaxID=306 RepID=UPI002B9635DB|nr:OprD family porin [Pseudomonas sp.]HTO20819.1 OprD family porin [Pseudomonas sp.]
MHVMKLSAIALAVTAGASQLALASAQSEAKGLVEDSSFDLFNRNLYFNRDFRNNGDDPDGQSKVEEWAHGFTATFESGFTPGIVGFGFDAYGMVGLKLDSSPDRTRTGLLPVGSDGYAEDEYAEAGGVIKARMSSSVLKYGQQIVGVPVFATDDSRLLPETATGFLLTSNEIEGLEINAGHFTALNAQAQTGHDSLGLTSADFIGGTYAVDDNFSASLYYSDVKDFWQKVYGNLNYTVALANEQAVNLDFNIYRTDYEEVYTGTGDEEGNTIWSLAASYSLGAHRFMLAYQKSIGGFDGIGYDYGVDGGGAVYLANSVQRSDFNAEDEKSWQARYDLDLAAVGLNGFKFMTRYTYGDDADVGTTDNGKEWERDIEVRYVVPEGPAKDLSLRLRQATYRSSDGVYYGSPSIDEVRVIIEYPLSIL